MYNKENILIQSLHHKTHVAELWHGKGDCYSELSLEERADILLRVKELVAEMDLHNLDASLNFAMTGHDLLWPAAALLAWKKGMKLHLAICVGSPTDAGTQFIRTGHLDGDQRDKVREAAAVILNAIGALDAREAVLRGEEIQLDEEQLRTMNNMLGVDIVTDSRADNYIKKIHEMCEYVIHRETGRVYTGLQDYRVVWAESTPSIILALHDPMEMPEHICEVLKLADETALREAAANGRKRYAEY